MDRPTISRPLVQDGKLDREALAADLRPILDRLVTGTCLELSYQIRFPEAEAADAIEHPEVLVVFQGRDEGLLLECNAELLKALEHIALRCLRLEPRFYDHVRFDAADYRALRIEELKLSARVAAQRVCETHQPFRFQPLSPRERRILHLALKDVPGVRTSSEGVGEDRQVVVYPTDSK